MNTNLHRVIGIDLGTTYSAVAAFNSFTEQAQIIPNAEDSVSPQTTPSVVSIMGHTGQIIVGRPGKLNLPNNPLNTIVEIKREMGDVFREETLDKFSARGLFRSKDKDFDGDPVKVQFNGQWFTPQEISALILMKMKWIAEQEMGGEIFDAVITVPAYFKQQQRKATEEAARLAGLYPRQLIPEPTAAAICYGVDQYEETRKIYMVYDLGGGTFDVSIITVEEQKIDVIATSGDPRLGGGDFDDAITAWAVNELKEKYGLDVGNDFGAKAFIKLQAEQAKIQLSTFETVTLDLTRLNPQYPPRLELQRDAFTAMIEDLLNKSLNFVDQAINISEAQKGVRRDEITAILLVGGSSKIPRVRTKLLEYFQKDESFLRANLDPDAVVARGAAIMATRFQPSTSFDISKKAETSFMTTDVAQDVQISLITEHSLGVGVQDDQVKRIVELGTNIPVSVTSGGFINSGPSPYLHVPVYQGEGQYAYQNTLIGELALGPMEPQQEGYHRFEVTFTLDRDGLLSMMVRHLNEGKTYQATFDQKTSIKEKDIAIQREKLLNLWQNGFGMASARSSPAPVTEMVPPSPTPKDQPQSAPSEVVPPSGAPQTAVPQPPLPVPSAESVEKKAAESGVAPSEIHVLNNPIPEQFKQLVRRVQKQMTKESNPQLLKALNAFIDKLNAGAAEDDLVDLGDELADAFDAVRR